MNDAEDEYDGRHLKAMPALEEGETPVEYQKPISMMFSNRTYDKLKWIAQILLPALGTLYGTIGFIWGLPEVTKVVATIVALDFFIGTLLGISQKAYEKSGAAYDGEVNMVQKDDGGQAMLFDLNAHPEVLQKQKQVTFKVNQE